MGQVRWTGHPFVDAGLAALVAGAKVSRLEDLDVNSLDEACGELARVLLSDQALGLGVDGKSFVKGPLSQVFPNSELVNASNWRGDTPAAKAENVRTKFLEGLKRDLQSAKLCLTETGEAVCNTCGGRFPGRAMTLVRKDKVPLLSGAVNFYPGLAWGPEVCGLCALAVRFFPMSVMRTGVSNRLWFLHTQVPEVAIKISQNYGWQRFNAAIAANEALDFYSKWQTAGDAGTVIYLLCELLDTFANELENIYQESMPTIAYIFSNDNRGGFVNALPVPNGLLRFLAQLRVESETGFKRFWGELLSIPGGLSEADRKGRIRFVSDVAERLLLGRSILHLCLDPDGVGLRGGWLGHRRYLLEVQNMPDSRLATLERLGLTIAQSDDAKKAITQLRNARANEVFAALLRFVRAGWLSHQELYTLLPPNEEASASEIRDVLLAVIYEWQRCRAEGREFPPLLPPAQISPDDTLRRLQEVGQKLLDTLPNPGRWVGQLQTAGSSERIRAVYLAAVQRGALGFDDFIFLAPLGDSRRLWLLRDYLLALLFDKAREELPALEEIAVGREAEVLEETNEGGSA